MKLSKAERLILANQFQLLSEQDENNEYIDKKRCSQYVKILLEGYELLYDDIFSGMDEEVSSEQCNFVLDVLSMYRIISNSFYQLPEKTLTEEDIAFAGFDGNEETKEYSFLKFFINDYDRFRDLKKNKHMEENSHSRMVPRYIQQLEIYNSIIESKKGTYQPYGNELTEEEIKRVLGLK